MTSFEEFKRRYADFQQNYKHRVSLRGIRIFSALSEETECFSATLYIDDEKAGTVSNRGHGGCHDYTDHKRVRAVCDELRDSEKAEGREPMVEGLDALVNAVLDDHMMLKDAKRWSKAGKIVFRWPGMAEGSWQVVKWPDVAKRWPDSKCEFVDEARKKDWIKGDESEIVFANDLLVTL
jgi:hypothetical protein